MALAQDGAGGDGRPGKSRRGAMPGGVPALVLLSALWACGGGDEAPRFGSGGPPPGCETIRIVFGGDTAFAESYGDRQRRLLEANGYDFPLAKLKPIVENADLVICNLETPLTDIETSPHEGNKGYIHWGDTVRAPAACRENNLRAFSLANNHTMDFGAPGLKQTLGILEGNGIDCFGAGLDAREAAEPLVKDFSRPGVPFKLAVIGAFEYLRHYDLTYGFYAGDEKPGCNRLKIEDVETQIAALRKRDPGIFVVVTPHWGKNYAWKNWTQSHLGRALIRAGADLVVGHGAHGMQEIERYRGKWILYGLGNFVFLTEGRYAKTRHPPYSFAAALMVCDGTPGPEIWLRLYPILSDNLETGFQPRPLNAAEFQDFCRLLGSRSPLSKADAGAISAGREGALLYLQFRAAGGG